MTTSQPLSIACSAVIMAAWATQGVADDKATDTQTSRAQAETPAAVTPGTVNPAPSTYRTEATAADRTVPGATRTRSTEPGTANPLPATNRTEGTAADRTPPGNTPVRGAAAAQAPEQSTSRVARRDVPAGTPSAAAKAAHAMRGTNLIGLAVRDEQGSNVGSVQDVIIDAAHGRLAYALVGFASSRGHPSSLVAVPWRAFAPMIESDGVVVVDRSKIASAPQIAESELRQQDGHSWREAADRYWGRSKSASAQQSR